MSQGSQSPLADSQYTVLYTTQRLDSPVGVIVGVYHGLDALSTDEPRSGHDQLLSLLAGDLHAAVCILRNERKKHTQRTRRKPRHKKHR